MINSRNKAIRLLYSNVVTIDFDDTKATDASGKVVVLNESLIETEIIKLNKEYLDNDYARKREAEYPTIAELTIALYDGADKKAIVAKRNSVKLKYPKPE